MKKAIKRSARRLPALLMPAVVAVLTNPLWAQTPAPPPGLKKSAPPWLGLLVMFLLLAVVMAVSLMPSKRSHQD